jgi:hypothetical protein
MRLLKQKVDAFNLITDQKKLKAINRLLFLMTLKNLKHYLSLTE